MFKSNYPDEIKKICEHVRSIQHQIPGLANVSYFENLGDGSNGYNQMGIMDFNDHKYFINWTNHPYHKEVTELLKKIAKVLFFDYELL